MPILITLRATARVAAAASEIRYEKIARYCLLAYRVPLRSQHTVTCPNDHVVCRHICINYVTYAI